MLDMLGEKGEHKREGAGVRRGRRGRGEEGEEGEKG